MIYGFDDDKHKVEVMSHSGDVIVLNGGNVTFNANEEKTFEFTSDDGDLSAIFLGSYMMIPQMGTRSQSSLQYYPISITNANINYPLQTANITVKNESNSAITGSLLIIFMRFSH